MSVEEEKEGQVCELLPVGECECVSESARREQRVRAASVMCLFCMQPSLYKMQCLNFTFYLLHSTQHIAENSAHFRNKSRENWVEIFSSISSLSVPDSADIFRTFK